MHFTHNYLSLICESIALVFNLLCFIYDLTLNYIDLLYVVSDHNCIVYEGQGEDTLDILHLDDW